MVETRHIVPTDDGRWAVKDPNSSRNSAVLDTQEAAQARTRRILENAGGGEMITHGRNGAIRSKDTIAPGNDPRDRRG